MKVIIGLGNPGNEYHKTRHNAGFMVVDRLAVRHHLADNTKARLKFHAGMLEGAIANEKCILLQPMTYMNRSGTTIREVVDFYKLDWQNDLLVIVDDVALPCGKIRLRSNGGTGGHNGLADIERVLNSSEYPRLRIGIDPPGRMIQSDYVLGRFTAEQLENLEPAIERACDAVESWISQGLDKTMSLFNADMQ